MNSKRGVSPVIATVLLIVLTIVIVGILAIFVVPFTQDSLDGSKECLNVISKLSFDESQYNCNAKNLTDSRTGFSVQVLDDSITAFRVTLFKEETGAGATYDILPDQVTGNEHIRMLDKNFNETLQVPKKGEIRTYVADDLYSRIEIYPLLSNGNTCEEHDTIQITSCVSSSVSSKLLAN